MNRFAAYVSIAALLAGCAPSLNQVVRTTQAYGVPQRCSQGPFEIHVPAFGSRWGEDFTVEARGNAVAGHETLSIDGRVVSNGDFATPDATVDAHACVLSDADRAAAPAGDANVATSSPSTSADATAPVKTGGTVKLVPAGIPMAPMHTTVIGRYDVAVTSWELAPSVLKRGQDLKLVFWSPQPIDLTGTTFVVTHSEMVAPDGDKKWEAHLDEVRADAQRAQREADAKAHEEARCAAARGADAKCHDEGYKTGGEIAAYDAFQQKCEEMARRNATDQACRDDGWRNDSERPQAIPASPTITAAPPAPSRPPPAPQVETEPPKPSEHAEWIGGSWQWNGADWVWLGGGWRVPEQDRAQKLTATAPSPPPAAPVETRPPQPIASAVWADGYWHYAGGRWIWVPGRWAVPPRAGATWRPSAWVREGVQLRLDPGGWR